MGPACSRRPRRWQTWRLGCRLLLLLAAEAEGALTARSEGRESAARTPCRGDWHAEFASSRGSTPSSQSFASPAIHSLTTSLHLLPACCISRTWPLACDSGCFESVFAKPSLSLPSNGRHKTVNIAEDRKCFRQLHSEQISFRQYCICSICECDGKHAFVDYRGATRRQKGPMETPLDAHAAVIYRLQAFAGL
jgi:hypothetical protein